MKWGFAEVALVMIGALGVAVITAALMGLAMRRDEPQSLQRARRLSIWRATVSIGVALVVLAIAVAVHIRFPWLEGVPFLLGPLAAAAAGLGTFALMPPPSIDGAVRRRTADVAPRTLAQYSSITQRTTFVVIAVVTTVVVLVAGVSSKLSTDGRSICTSVFPAECPGGGPLLFPGWLFAAPALVLIAALGVATHYAVRRIIAAPATAWPELSAADTALRRSGVRLSLRIAGTALALTTALFFGLAAFPLINAQQLDTGLTTTEAVYAAMVGMILLGAAAFAFVYSIVATVLTVTSAFTAARVPATASLEPALQ